eukprot:1465192-Prymnesium_polylepis.1
MRIASSRSAVRAQMREGDAHVLLVQEMDCYECGSCHVKAGALACGSYIGTAERVSTRGAWRTRRGGLGVARGDRKGTDIRGQMLRRIGLHMIVWGERLV